MTERNNPTPERNAASPNLWELPWAQIDINAMPQYDREQTAEVARDFNNIIDALHLEFSEHVRHSEPVIPQLPPPLPIPENADPISTALIKGHNEYIAGLEFHPHYLLALEMPTDNQDHENNYWLIQTSISGPTRKLFLSRMQDNRQQEHVAYVLGEDKVLRRHAVSGFPMELYQSHLESTSLEELVQVDTTSFGLSPAIGAEELEGLDKFIFSDQGVERDQSPEALEYQRALARLECHLHTDTPVKFSNIVAAFANQSPAVQSTLIRELNADGDDVRALFPYYGPRLLQLLTQKEGLDFGLDFYARILQEARNADNTFHPNETSGTVMVELANLVKGLATGQLEPRSTEISFTAQDGVLVPQMTLVNSTAPQPVASAPQNPKPTIDYTRYHSLPPLNELPEWNLLIGSDVEATPDSAAQADIEAEAKRTYLTDACLVEAFEGTEQRLLPLLTESDFADLHILTRNILKNPDDFTAFRYLMAIHDVGKSNRVREALGAGPHIDHDTLLSMLFLDEYEAVRRELLPTFDTLSERGQALIKRIIRSTFNYPQALQGEAPATFWGEIHNDEPLIRGIELLKGIFDIAGALGHRDSSKSLSMTSSTWQKMDNLNFALQSSQFASARERYHRFLDEEVAYHSRLRPSR